MEQCCAHRVSSSTALYNVHALDFAVQSRSKSPSGAGEAPCSLVPTGNNGGAAIVGSRRLHCCHAGQSSGVPAGTFVEPVVPLPMAQALAPGLCGAGPLSPPSLTSRHACSIDTTRHGEQGSHRPGSEGSWSCWLAQCSSEAGLDGDTKGCLVLSSPVQSSSPTGFEGRGLLAPHCPSGSLGSSFPPGTSWLPPWSRSSSSMALFALGAIAGTPRRTAMWALLIAQVITASRLVPCWLEELGLLSSSSSPQFLCITAQIPCNGHSHFKNRLKVMDAVSSLFAA